MRTIIALNGEKHPFRFEDGDYTIACDGAYSALKELGIKPDKILGDFDSLGFVPDGAEVYPAEKDMTDGELAVEYCIKEGRDDVLIIWAGGLREDHFLGNLALLRKANKFIKNCAMLTKRSFIFFADRSFCCKVENGATVSVVACEPTRIVSSSGLKYAYRDTTLKSDCTLGISNVAVNDFFSLDIEGGAAFVIVGISLDDGENHGLPTVVFKK